MDARFELIEDDDSGRRYSYGAQTDWKQATEVGTQTGELVMRPEHFATGTIVLVIEPDMTPEEADRAYDESPAIPMTAEEIKSIVQDVVRRTE